MPTQNHGKTIFSLKEVTNSIQATISKRYGSSFWVKAEMNKLNFYKHSGHCYPELVEKQDGKVIAQIKSILWKSDYDRVNQQFLSLLKEPLKDGIKILFEARITFDAVYGLALIISDIDPSFTLGDLESEKLEAIKRLKSENLLDKNKSLRLPILPQRLAIISVETSKGYADFIKIINQNEWNYKFFHLLFPSLLQGDKAVRSIMNQLDRIQTVKHHFDIVAIIRGGGGDIGLSCYNHYDLAQKIANFPLPVITGIGHATNETVTDMVAHSNLITPTKVGEFLLQKFHNFSVPVQNSIQKIASYSKALLNQQQSLFDTRINLFQSVTENRLLISKGQIENIGLTLNAKVRFALQAEQQFLNNKIYEIEKSSQYFLKENRSQLQSVTKEVENMHPDNVLKRGYSITLHNGKSIKDLSLLKDGDELKTLIYQGSINSIVNSVKKADNE